MLAPPAKQRTAVLQTGCLYEILDAYAALTAEQLLVGGALPEPGGGEAGRATTTRRSRRPAPRSCSCRARPTRRCRTSSRPTSLLGQLEAYDTQPVDFVAVNGANHDGAVFATTSQVADWIAARFA